MTDINPEDLKLGLDLINTQLLAASDAAARYEAEIGDLQDQIDTTSNRLHHSRNQAHSLSMALRVLLEARDAAQPKLGVFSPISDLKFPDGQPLTEPHPFDSEPEVEANND